MKVKNCPLRFALALCLAAAAFTTANAADPVRGAAKPVVHLISLGDSDADIGRHVGEDAENTAAAFQKAFADAGRANQLKTYLLLGADAAREPLFRTIADLDV